MQINSFYTMIMQVGKFFKDYGLEAEEEESLWEHEVWRIQSNSIESIY